MPLLFASTRRPQSEEIQKPSYAWEFSSTAKGRTGRVSNKSRFSFGKYALTSSSQQDGPRSIPMVECCRRAGCCGSPILSVQFHEQGIGTNKNQDLADAFYAQSKQAGFDSTLAIDLLRMEYDGIPPVVREPEVEIADLAPAEAAEIEIISTTPIRRKLSVATSPSRSVLSVPCAPFK